MNRRNFLVRLPALGAGVLALLKGANSWSKGLPSDPGSSVGGASGTDAVSLPPFEKHGGFPLERALLERQSTRSYDPSRKLSVDEISRLLWAAAGVNRPEGRRTAPSAMAKYPVELLAALPGGVFLYEPDGHRLKRMLSKDMRAAIPRQDGLKEAGMIVLYVVDKDKVPRGRLEWADIEIGCMGQSLYLEAAALGLGSCMFAYIDLERTTAALRLEENQVLRIAQAVGKIK